LTDEARIGVEKEIDSMLKTPKRTERTFRYALKSQGIQPNLETLLAFLAGDLYGYVWGLYIHKYKRMLNQDENNELIDLLKRRAFELREAFVGTRIEE